MEKINQTYEKVRNIVLRCFHDFHLHGWDQDDWEQEAYIILYLLLEKHPQLMEDENKLYTFFKTKFKNYILDQIRKQESLKRKFNKPNYEEIGEVGHRIRERGVVMDDYILLREDLKKIYQKGSQKERLMINKLIAGERFKGRKAFIKEMRIELKEHNPYKK